MKHLLFISESDLEYALSEVGKHMHNSRFSNFVGEDNRLGITIINTMDGFVTFPFKRDDELLIAIDTEMRINSNKYHITTRQLEMYSWLMMFLKDTPAKLHPNILLL